MLLHVIPVLVDSYTMLVCIIGCLHILKLERMPRWMWGAVACSSVVRVLVAKAGGNSLVNAWDFSPFNWLTNVDVVKDLWYSNTVWLLKINIQQFVNLHIEMW